MRGDRRGAWAGYYIHLTLTTVAPKYDRKSREFDCFQCGGLFLLWFLGLDGWYVTQLLFEVALEALCRSSGYIRE